MFEGLADTLKEMGLNIKAASVHHVDFYYDFRNVYSETEQKSIQRISEQTFGVLPQVTNRYILSFKYGTSNTPYIGNLETLGTFEFHGVEPVIYISSEVRGSQLAMVIAHEYGHFADWVNGDLSYNCPKFDKIYRKYVKLIKKNGIYDGLTREEQQYLIQRDEVFARMYEVTYWTRTPQKERQPESWLGNPQYQGLGNFTDYPGQKRLYRMYKNYFKNKGLLK